MESVYGLIVSSVTSEQSRNKRPSNSIIAGAMLASMNVAHISKLGLLFPGGLSAKLDELGVSASTSSNVGLAFNCVVKVKKLYGLAMVPTPSTFLRSY